ncbi:MAG: hypothetical protein ABI472_20830 [Ginsengibacter sp.]
MTTSSHVSRKVTAALALIILMLPLIFFIMWSSIGVKVTGISAAEELSIYLGYFPVWLQNISLIHAISIACCTLTIILATRSFSKHLLSIRVLMLVASVVAVFILLFNIYQIV